MEALSPEQLENFAKINERLGLAPDEYTFSAEQLEKLQASKKDIIFSSDPVESDVPPRIIAVASIAHLKELIGMDDAEENSELAYPPPISKEMSLILEKAVSREDLMNQLDKKARESIDVAATAFIMGNSTKVKDYEGIINATMFPTKLAVFTTKNLNIPAGTVHTIKGPGAAVLNFGTITVGKNAQLKITTKFTITAQKFIQN